MRVLLLCTLMVSAVLSYPLNITEYDVKEWEFFKIMHGKEYGSALEELQRQLVFLDNLRFVREHNLKFYSGQTTFDVEINKFADMTAKEFAKLMNGYRRSPGHTREDVVSLAQDEGPLPSYVDWRKKGAVTPIKDQGQCGSCWAFSATGSLEGQSFRKTKKLVSLSEQNLVDCSQAEGNQGCNGGLMDQAFKYIKNNKGIDTEKAYPYEAQDGSCRYKPKDKGASDVGFVDVPPGSEAQLQAAVVKVGPISVAIDASYPSFQLYKGGVYKEPQCSTDDLDHGVLAVGYGSTKAGQDYWIVKNSWGESWGMKGYILMARNNNNMCGIATAASYPKV